MLLDLPAVVQAQISGECKYKYTPLLARRTLFTTWTTNTHTYADGTMRQTYPTVGGGGG